MCKLIIHGKLTFQTNYECRVIKALGLNFQTALDQDFPSEQLRHESDAQDIISFKLFIFYFKR